MSQTDRVVLVTGAAGNLGAAVCARFAADGSFDPTYDPDVTGAFGHSTPGIYAMVSPGPDQLVIGGTFAFFGQSPMMPKNEIVAAYAARCVDRPAFKRSRELDGTPG